MIHVITGLDAAKNLEAAFELDENLRGEIVILQDNLSLGPVCSEYAESKHNDFRTAFWKHITRNEEIEYIDENLIKLLIVKAEREEEPVCFWLSPNAADVCAYFWLLPYFKSHPGMLHTINIIGLPFLNEKGQLFYPTHFSQIPAKEFSKTKRLLKEVTLAEYETEGDEWQRFVTENKSIRIYEGGKKITCKEDNYFDLQIKNTLGTDFQKASKIINEVVKKSTHSPHAAFIENRIRELITSEEIAAQGDFTKTAKDFEIKKVGETVSAEAVMENA